MTMGQGNLPVSEGARRLAAVLNLEKFTVGFSDSDLDMFHEGLCRWQRSPFGRSLLRIAAPGLPHVGEREHLATVMLPNSFHGLVTTEIR